MKLTKKMRLSKTAIASIREKALSDYLFFRVEIIGRKNIEGNQFQEELCAFTQEDRKPIKLIRVPRGHGKSTNLADEVIWHICKDRNERILISGPMHKHAQKILDEIKEIVENNLLLRTVFEDVWGINPRQDQPAWVQTHIKINRDVVNKNPTIETAGIDTGLTGSHYTRIYLDDQVNEGNYKSKQMRDAVWNHTLACYALLDDTPQKRAYLCYTNTPWHVLDATMRLTSVENPFVEDVDLFERNVYLSQTEDASLGVIWPEVRDETFIATQRKKGMRTFAPHYLMKPRGDADHPFDVQKLQRFELDYRIDDDGVARWTHPEGREFYIHMAVDTNNNADTAADPASILIAAKDHQGHVWFLGKKRFHPTTPQLLDAQHELFMKWRPISLQIELRGKEDRFYYEIMRYALTKGVGYPIHKRTRGGRTSKSSKYSRIAPMSAPVSEGTFHVPNGVDWQDFIEEMDLYDENCEHDDMLDCAADIYHFGRCPMPPKAETDADAPKGAHLIRVFTGYAMTQTVAVDGKIMVARQSRMMV